MSNEIVKSKKEMIQYVIDGIVQSLEARVVAAQTYVQAIETYPECKDEIIEAARESGVYVDRRFLNCLEAIGRGRFHPMLLTESGRHVARIKRLPLSDQRDIFDKNKRYPLLLDDGEDHLRVEVRSLSMRQLDQLFADDHIRNLAEQKKWRAEHTGQAVTGKEIKVPYAILKSPARLKVGNVVLTKSQLKNILIEM